MAICVQNLPFVAFTKPEILRFEVYYRKAYSFDMAWKSALKIGRKGYGSLQRSLVLDGNLWYRIPIGTLSMGCYGNEGICDRQLSQWRDVAASALVD